MNLDKAIVPRVRWLDVIPERLREHFLNELKDPSIYSMRTEIALNNLYIRRLLGEMNLYPALAGHAPVELQQGDRITATEGELWAKLGEAYKVKALMIQTDVKTIGMMSQYGAQQAARAEAITSVVNEILRRKLAGTDEGRQLLLQIADELEDEVRALGTETKP